MAKKRKKGMSLSSKIAKQLTQVAKSKSISSSLNPIIVKGKSIQSFGSKGLIELSNIRGLPEKESLYGLKNLLSSKQLRNSTIGYKFPKTIEIKDKYHYGSSGKTLSFDLEFEATILNSFASEISTFIKYKELFDAYLLGNKLILASHCLQDIFNEFGYSNWYVSSLLNLMYENNKHIEIIEYNKKTSQEFELKKFNPIAKVPLNYSGIRCEKGVSYERFEFAVQNQAEEFRLSKNFARTELIDFENFYSPDKEYSYLSEFIVSNSANNIVDRYLGFRRILSSCAIQNIGIKSASATLLKLSDNISDRVFNNILSVLNLLKVTPNKNDLLLISICDLYVGGHYEDVISKCEELLESSPVFTSCIEIYIKSLIRTQKRPSSNNLLFSLVDKVIELYREPNNLVLNKILQKEFLRLCHCDWAYFIKLQFQKFIPSTNNVSIERYYLFLDMQCSLFNPFSKIDIESNSDIKEQINSVSYQLLKKSKTFDSEYVDNERLLKVQGDGIYSLGVFSEAKQKYLELAKSNDSLFNLHAYSRIVLCDFYDGNKGAAIEELSRLIINSQNYSQLPINTIAKYIIDDPSEVDESELIDRAIILYGYNKNNKDNSHLLSLICEDIFDIKGIDSFKTVAINTDEKELFLFENILTEDVLESFDIFESLEEVYIFRSFIIQELLNIESYLINKISLKNDLFKVYEKLVKEKCLIECGVGKIEVDTSMIKSQLSSQLIEVFHSITQLKYVPVTQNDFIDFKDNSHDYSISSNEYFTRTLELFYKIRDEYSINPVYGLDNFLNMNIRHGGIVNLLWYPIKKYKISYLKNKKGSYEKENYWFEQYPYLTDKNKVILSDAFTDFSKAIDKHVQIAKSWIHINTGEFSSDEKLFNFFTDSDEIIDLCEKIDSTSSLDIILDDVINKLNEATNTSLAEIHKKIESNLRKDLTKAYKQLLSRIKDISHLDELNRKIKLSQNELNERIDELKNWLDWKKETTQAFILNLSIEAAKDMAMNLHPNFNIEVNIDNNSNYALKGESFRKFTTIFLILIDNAIIHAVNKSDIQITFLINSEDNAKKSIQITNNIDKSQIPELKQKIHEVNSTINKQYILEANKESGSGLFKVKKLLTNGLEITNMIELFVCEESLTYGVNFLLDMDTLYEP
jgi:hypothetical protein